MDDFNLRNVQKPTLATPNRSCRRHDILGNPACNIALVEVSISTIRTIATVAQDLFENRSAVRTTYNATV